MENSLKLQLDVRNNATDLQNYMLDLNNWEEEMKRKESALSKEKLPEPNIPPPRNKIKKVKQDSDKNHSKKPKKISGYDYSAWDKFDVEKACAEIDQVGDKEEPVQQSSNETETDEEEEEEDDETENDNSTNEKKLSLVDEAFYEKELGNQFVKKEQWNDAIKCYTNAIKLDPKNAIYYANRSLCFLKTKNLKSAEVDATVAIQLDKTYVKAFQRRAFARLALGQLIEAKADYERVLELEPKNALARVEISKIDDKLSKESKLNAPVQQKSKTFNAKDIFKQEEKNTVKKNVDSSKSKPVSLKPVEVQKNVLKGGGDAKKISTSSKESKIERGAGDAVDFKKETSPTKEFCVFEPLPEGCKIVYPINLPPHKRSKMPLRRINIVEVDDDDDDFPFQEEPITTTATIISEKKDENEIHIKPIEVPELSEQNVSLDIPKTSIQFRNCWKVIKNNPEKAYSYLEKIPWYKLPEIFENSLESDFFSELITFLAKDDKQKNIELVYNFLLGLSSVKRFSSMILFMSNKDKACVEKCIKEIENIKSKEEVSNLIKLYEL